MIPGDAMKTFKHFIGYYKPYKFVFFFDLFCALTISLIDLAFPLILNYCTDTMFIQKSVEILQGLIWLLAGLLVLYVIRALCRYYVSAQGHIMGAHMERDMRKELFDQYQRLSFSYYDKHNTGIMMSRVVSDLFDICEFAHHGPENLFISLIKIIGSFVILSLIYWPLALLLFIVTLIMLVFSYTQNKSMRATFMDNRRKIGDVNAALQDSLAGIRAVQSFTNEDIEREKFAHSNNEFLASKKRNYRVMGTYYGMNNFFQGLLYVTVLVGGGYFVAMGNLSPLTLATFALYVNIFVAPIDILIEFTEMLQKGFSGFKRFEEVMKEVPDIQDAKNAHPLENVHGDISFKDVSFTYNKEESVLEHVNLDIPAGKKVALVGPSGSGKTTLCSLIPRFYEVTEGNIKIDGVDIRDVNQHDLRDKIGLVPQKGLLFSGTIRSNLTYGAPEATDDELEEVIRVAQAKEFIDNKEERLDSEISQGGTNVSGGQKQRLAIARAIAKNPEIFIFDDSFSALDFKTDAKLRQELDKMVKKTKNTVLIVGQRIASIMGAEQIIVLDEGKIVGKGTHEELMKNCDVYQEIAYSQLSKEELGHE